MAALANLSTEERIGIGAAAIVHVALAGGLAWMAQQRDLDIPPPPQRVDVSLATEVSMESTAPDPSAEPAASLAPVVSELPSPPEQVVAAPEPVVRPTTPPRVTPTTRASARSTPAPAPSARASTRPAPTPSPAASRPPSGGRLSDDFLEGSSASQGTRGQPAATFGPQERASLVSAISRQLRPNWSAPRGQDWELLTSRVSWSLNRDGTVRGTPRCTQVGTVTDSNRPQVSVHCEAAIRAVRTTRFNLPEQFYSQWDDLEFDFDRRL